VNDKKCQDCKSEYQSQNGKKTGSCPFCGSKFWTLNSLSQEQSSAPRVSPAKDIRRDSTTVAAELEIGKLIASHNKNALELIASQNRTTHAVRSLAITFVAAPVILTAVVMVIALSIISGSTALVVLTSVAALIVCGLILYASLTELGKSRIT
jgi:hypothetical protein